MIIISLFTGLCIKVRTKDDKKLFLNLCKTDEVPAPEEISEAQLLKVWSEELDYRVPMSIGQLKTDVDKSNFEFLPSFLLYNILHH